MRIAVTGGTGFVGAHSVRALLDAGHRVRLLVHPSDTPEASLAPLGIELDDGQVVVGDVCDRSDVARLLEGCDAVLHAAGVVGVDDSREDLMWRVNVDATRQLFRMADERGLDPIVHVASYSALFPSPDAVIGPDSPTTTQARSAYGRTKSAADRIAREMQAAGVPIVVTYPSSIVGPPAGPHRGITADGWAPLLRFGVSISFDGGMAMVDVRDVAAVHAAVMEPGRGPRRYVCGGHMVDFDHVIDTLALASGRRIRRIRVSRRAMLGLGRLSDALARVLPVSPALSYEAAWLLTTRTPTDDSRTLQDLGVTWRPIEAALADSLPATAGRGAVKPDPRSPVGDTGRVNERDDRPWGAYEVLEDADGHKVKRIEVRPGSRLSYQRHTKRAEHWFVVSGQAEVTLDGSVHRLGPGDAIDIPRGAAHRMANPGADDVLVFIEVQHGDYFGEDDIERLEDDFGRAG